MFRKRKSHSDYRRDQRSRKPPGKEMPIAHSWYPWSRFCCRGELLLWGNAPPCEIFSPLCPPPLAICPVCPLPPLVIFPITPPDHLSSILYMLSFHNLLEKIVDIYKSTKLRNVYCLLNNFLNAFLRFFQNTGQQSKI